MPEQHYEIQFDENNIDKRHQLTLNEPISTTIMRDLQSIYIKLKFAMIPSMRQSGKKQLRNWDLWGPLLLTLMLSITLSFRAGQSTQSIVTSIFVIMWIGSGAVWLNANFLGSNMTFCQSACLLGYCLFPINVVSLITCILGSHILAIFKLVLVSISFVWATLSSISFISQMIPERKRKLALYPIALFYLFLSWFVLIV